MSRARPGAIPTRRRHASCTPARRSVEPETTLADAAGLMARRHATHLLVLDPASSLPVAVLSTLDVVGEFYERAAGGEILFT